MDQQLEKTCTTCTGTGAMTCEGQGAVSCDSTRPGAVKCKGCGGLGKQMTGFGNAVANVVTTWVWPEIKTSIKLAIDKAMKEQKKFTAQEIASEVEAILARKQSKAA